MASICTSPQLILQDASPFSCFNKVDSKSVFMKSLQQGYEGLKERPLEGLNQGPVNVVVGCAQGGFGFLMSPFIGGISSLHRLSEDMMRKTQVSILGSI